MQRIAERDGSGLRVILVPRTDAPEFLRREFANLGGEASLIHLAWPDMRAASSDGGGTAVDDGGWRQFVAWSVEVREACAEAGIPFVGIGSGVEPYAEPGSDLGEPYLTYAQRKSELRSALSPPGAPEISWVRLHFIFGPHEFPHRIVPSAIRAALEGAELVCNSRDRRRHWLHVDDIATNLCAFAATPKPGVWDITGPKAVSYNELFAMVEKAVGRPLKLAYAQSRTPDGQLKLVAPTNLALNLPQPARRADDLLVRLTEYAQWMRAEPWRKAMTSARRVHTCRLCRGPLSAPVLSLGAQPISNRLPKISESAEITPIYPLDISLCETCGLAQLSHDLDASEHFNDDYTYVSGASSTWVEHCRGYAERLIDKHGVSSGDFVVEVGSNDGTLLKAFAAEGVQGLGVEPSGNVAEMARKDGVETLTAFFNAESVTQIKLSHGRPKAVIGNNVLAHVPDTHAFLSAARELIADDGFMCFEFPHFTNILERRYFDTIYHEHYAYLGVGPLLHWAGKNGMEIYAVEPQTIHGGSLRVFLRRSAGAAVTPPSVTAILDKERRLAGPAPWHALDRWLRTWREEFRAMIAGFHQEGRLVAAYAAASKATVICNFLGLTSSDIAYCCDASPLKQGRSIPGTGIPIVEPSVLTRNPADVVIVFAWNIFDEITPIVSRLTPGALSIVRPLPETQVLVQPSREPA